MDITTDGLVIREVLINDNDKLLTILTSEYGKISVMAKGVKGIKSKNASAVQIFCYSTFELLKNGERYSLKTAQLKESFYEIRDNMLAFSLSAYVIDVVSAICTENTDENDIFRLALNTLYALSKLNEQNKPLWQIKGAFELKVISLAGFMPDLEGCGACGAEAFDEEQKIAEGFFDERKRTSFYILEGSLLCNDCRKSEELTEQRQHMLKLSEPTLRAMRYILSAPQNKYLAFRLSDNYAEEFSSSCEKFLLTQMERSFDTLEFFKNAFDDERKREG